MDLFGCCSSNPSTHASPGGLLSGQFLAPALQTVRRARIAGYAALVIERDRAVLLDAGGIDGAQLEPSRAAVASLVSRVLGPVIRGEVQDGHAHRLTRADGRRERLGRPTADPTSERGGENRMTVRREPLGAGGTWKTGQRVAQTGWYRDQHNVVSHHDKGATFPPCIGRKGECAFRHLIKAAATA